MKGGFNMAKRKNMVESAIIDNDVATDKVATVVNDEVETIEVKKELIDSEELEIVSLIPHVSYKDNRTGDFYTWDEVGHVEIMTWETIKNMWRNARGYFKDLWIKPLDNRVIDKLGLAKTYEKYDRLMDADSYTRKNISSICDEINQIPMGLKYTVFNKIKSMVISGEITDISVVLTLDKRYGLNLTEILASLD